MKNSSESSISGFITTLDLKPNIKNSVIRIIKPSFDDSVIGNLKIEYALLRIYKHISVLTNPQTPLPKKLEQIFLNLHFPDTSITFIKEFIVSKILKYVIMVMRSRKQVSTRVCV